MLRRWQRIWAALGQRGEVGSPQRFAVVTFGGALVLGTFAFVASLGVTRRSRRFSAVSGRRG